MRRSRKTRQRVAGRDARQFQRRRLSASEGGGVVMELLGLQHRARPPPRPDWAFTAPRTERPGRGADRGYSFVLMSHHTARGKARPVMG